MLNFNPACSLFCYLITATLLWSDFARSKIESSTFEKIESYLSHKIDLGKGAHCSGYVFKMNDQIFESTALHCFDQATIDSVAATLKRGSKKIDGAVLEKLFSSTGYQWIKSDAAEALALDIVIRPLQGEKKKTSTMTASAVLNLRETPLSQGEIIYLYGYPTHSYRGAYTRITCEINKPVEKLGIFFEATQIERLHCYKSEQLKTNIFRVPKWQAVNFQVQEFSGLSGGAAVDKSGLLVGMVTAVTKNGEVLITRVHQAILRGVATARVSDIYVLTELIGQLLEEEPTDGLVFYSDENHVYVRNPHKLKSMPFYINIPHTAAPLAHFMITKPLPLALIQKRNQFCYSSACFSQKEDFIQIFELQELFKIYEPESMTIDGECVRLGSYGYNSQRVRFNLKSKSSEKKYYFDISKQALQSVVETLRGLDQIIFLCHAL